MRIALLITALLGLVAGDVQAQQANPWTGPALPEDANPWWVGRMLEPCRDYIKPGDPPAD